VGVIQDLLSGVELPRMVKIRQLFPAPELKQLAEALRREIKRPNVGDRIKPGMRIAIAIGSRGVDRIAEIARIVAEEIKARGGKPFIVPAMGSHGGASAAGQVQVLANLGVTEETAGCPIISSMEVVEIGRLKNGLAVLIDKNAYEADGIVVVNRVKPHTQFRGDCESGLVKMITIGLGKQKGADSCHAFGFEFMADNILEMTKISLDREGILFGIATVENPYDKIAKIAAIPAENIIEEEKKLLIEAKENMPRIFFDQIDVLIVEKIGKEISGGGMDPNITGRYAVAYMKGGPAVNKLVVLDLTPQTHGNANGMGLADFTTRKLVDKIDYDAVYANALTIGMAVTVRIPMIMSSDKEAISAAVKTCNRQNLSEVRMVRIRDTLHLGEIQISEAMLKEARNNKQLEITGEPGAMRFDKDGNLE
jgi:hypothetical protein